MGRALSVVHFAQNLFNHDKFRRNCCNVTVISFNFSRLVTDEERKWTEENIDAVAKKHFPSIDPETALKRPILYSNWLTKDYTPVEQEELRDFVKARLKVNCCIGCFFSSLDLAALSCRLNQS